jgi:pyridoxamine 5'-phosphate oxidase
MDPLFSQALDCFRAQLDDAKALSTIPDPTAMTLATVDAEGRPNARIVLLKGLDERGFVFYTNLQSIKGQELLGQPSAALVFYWDQKIEQVRVQGRVEQVSDGEADIYFQSRARGSQLGAWASDQSQPLDGLEALKTRAAEVEARYEGQPVPRPPHWSGFRVVPDRIEFWYGRQFRLHERVVYTREADGWKTGRLFP